MRSESRKELLNEISLLFGEAFAYPGLYVTDGSCVLSSLAVNSSLTILANAERIAPHLVKRNRR